MKRLRRLGAVALIALLVSACASPEPSEQTLKDSFAEQVASAGIARDLTRTGNELTFLAPKSVKGKADAKWLVRIDSAVLEPQTSERNPFKGVIESSWFADGEALLSSGSFSGLPEEFLKKGIGQECYAFWDANTKAWTWE
jgi:hypothetical protein